ncbi:hypothetical protein RND81_09G101500 [Saponaria officinalis]|uniref:Late embryogenesis abundant protein LEA-2 subgroup domain-containing protein n=1 Tax=Saponaria officinalis TaxID=3572 RepID=A0AAW1IJ03_SAPOF
MTCWKWTVLILIAIFIIFVLPFIIYFVVVKPKNPTFTIDHASVNDFNLTSDGHLTAFFGIGIRANNPNHKMKLKYRHIRVSIFKDKQNLATDSFPGFTQRKHNVTVVRVQPVSLNVSLKKGPKFDFGVESGMGYVIFDVFMTSTLNAANLEVDCKGIMVNFTADNNNNNSNNGQNFQSSRGCSVLVYSDD